MATGVGAPDDARVQGRGRSIARVMGCATRLLGWWRDGGPALWVAWGFGLAQLVVVIVLADRLVRAGALSIDYAIEGGGFSQIAAGHLDPTVWLFQYVKPFIDNHEVFLDWPLALVIGLVHLPVVWTLLIGLQALPIAAIGPLVASYANLRGRELGFSARTRALVTLVPAALAALDVWQYWSTTFDYHGKALQGLVLVAALIVLERRRRAWSIVLVATLALMGDTASYVLAVVAVVLLLERRWRGGLAVLATAVAVLTVPSLLGFHILSLTGGLYSPLTPLQAPTYDVVVGVLKHPGFALGRLGRRLPDMWALLGGAGILGVASAMGIAAMAVIGPVVWLGIAPLGYAGVFQLVPLTDVLLLGAAVTLLRVARRRPRRALAIGGFAVAWAFGWFVVFVPHLVASIRAIAPADVRTGSTLEALATSIPPGHEVVAPISMVGLVAQDHPLVWSYRCRTGPISIPTFGVPLDIVVAPGVGVDTCSPGTLMAELARVAALPSASLRVLPGDVYVVEYDPGPGRGSLVLSDAAPMTGRELAPTFTKGSTQLLPGGAVALSPGPLALHGVTAELAPGAAGEALVRLEAEGSVSVQVWDDASGQLLAREELGTTTGAETLAIPFVVPHRFIPRLRSATACGRSSHASSPDALGRRRAPCERRAGFAGGGRRCLDRPRLSGIDRVVLPRSRWSAGTAVGWTHEGEGPGSAQPTARSGNRDRRGRGDARWSRPHRLDRRLLRALLPCGWRTHPASAEGPDGRGVAAIAARDRAYPLDRARRAGGAGHRPVGARCGGGSSHDERAPWETRHVGARGAQRQLVLGPRWSRLGISH